MYRKLVLVLAAVTVLVAAPLSAMDEDTNKRTAGQVVDDVTIAARLKTSLAADPVTEAVDIDVEVDKDTVQLNGFVDSEEERMRAEEIALTTKGVTSVRNNLQLQPRDRTAGEYGSDKILVSKVKAALAGDPVANALKIDVEADHGVISLGGHVDSMAERNAALAAAHRVKGVKEVIDNLEIRS